MRNGCVPVSQGLYVPDTSPTQWIVADDPLHKQIPKRIDSFTLEFGVRFYVGTPSNMVHQQTKYLFFLQVREDIGNGRLSCGDVELQLCAFAAQVLCGDYDPTNHQKGYLAGLFLLPAMTLEQENQIRILHEKLRGMPVLNVS